MTDTLDAARAGDPHRSVLGEVVQQRPPLRAIPMAAGQCARLQAPCPGRRLLLGGDAQRRYPPHRAPSRAVPVLTVGRHRGRGDRGRVPVDGRTTTRTLSQSDCAAPDPGAGQAHAPGPAAVGLRHRRRGVRSRRVRRRRAGRSDGRLHGGGPAGHTPRTRSPPARAVHDHAQLPGHRGGGGVSRGVHRDGGHGLRGVRREEGQPCR